VQMNGLLRYWFINCEITDFLCSYLIAAGK